MKFFMLVILLFALIIFVASAIGINIGTSLPPGYSFGVRDGRLAPCKGTPNCVSSQAQPSDRTHYTEPLKLNGDPEKAMEKLADIIKSMPRSRIIESKPDYIRAEFRSRIFKFVDDVEFYLDRKAGVLHARSGARTGKGDMGVNRRRIETIRALFEKA
jgi:uncharacterized protein (DUF1499 family)